MNTHYSSWKPMTIGSIILLGGIVIMGFALSCAPKEKSSNTDTTSLQAPIENKSEQPPQEKRPEIHITLLENGEYDIDGTHATNETFEQVLKAALGTYPKDYRRLIISGTPKDKNQLDRAITIADKLKAAISVKLGEKSE